MVVEMCSTKMVVAVSAMPTRNRVTNYALI